MRKIYSLVLLAAALLVGTNVWASNQTVSGSSFADLNAAIAATGGTGKVTLSQNISENVTTTNWVGVWIGAANYDASAQAIELDLNGHDITITGDNGKTLYPFVITKGELKVTGTGTISVSCTSTNSNINEGTNVFFVFGSYDYTQNPKATKPFTHLEIGANVVVTTTNGTIICVDRKLKTTPSDATTDYNTEYFSNGYGFAFGARVDVKGKLISQGGTKCYGIKTNGNLAAPSKLTAGKNPQAHKSIPDAESPWITDEYVANIINYDGNAPYVHVHPGSVINSDPRISKSAAIYCSGYAQWLIEGTCDGNIGVSVSSGDIDINNATITSSATTHTPPTSDGSVSGSGSAIVVNSRDAYAGAVDVNISGDTEVSSQSGYAIEEAVNTTSKTQANPDYNPDDPNSPETITVQETKVENITITGGSFQGGTDPVTHEDLPVIVVASSTNNTADITVYGGNVEGSMVVEGNETVNILDDKVAQDAHTTTVIVDGKAVTVISTGDAPTPQTTLSDIVTAYQTWVAGGKVGDAPSIKATGTLGDLTQDLVLTELEINEATVQTLTVKTGTKLTVGRAVLGQNARVIVEPGATFVVDGEQGFVAPVPENILLKASESAQATFLFHPNVTSNRHPHAKVEYQSNSFYNTEGGFNVLQFFAVPTYDGAVTNIETSSTAKIYFDVWRNTAWDYIGAINVPGDPDVMANLNKFDSPFGLYAITSKNDADHKPSFTFSGEMTGNSDHSFTLLRDWTTLANAYMGPIDRDAIIAQLATWNANYGTEQSVYVYAQNPSTGTITWTAKNKYDLPETGINAMQPLMFHNGSYVEGLELDYSALVWDPYVNHSAAPARQALSNITKVQINIAGENEMDYATIVADSELGEDRSFCAPKYNNPGLQLYVTSDDKYDIYASDEIENSYIGYRTVNAGMYTISFEDVQGENLVLVDLLSGARTNMTEGAIYTFYAEDNESNDYRFQVVVPANMPTSIDNTEADANTKNAGVYSITGQYLGNASIFNMLPAGVYVVDGEKKVK